MNCRHMKPQTGVNRFLSSRNLVTRHAFSKSIFLKTTAHVNKFHSTFFIFREKSRFLQSYHVFWDIMRKYAKGSVKFKVIQAYAHSATFFKINFVGNGSLYKTAPFQNLDYGLSREITFQSVLYVDSGILIYTF